DDGVRVDRVQAVRPEDAAGCDEDRENGRGRYDERPRPRGLASVETERPNLLHGRCPAISNPIVPRSVPAGITAISSPPYMTPIRSARMRISSKSSDTSSTAAPSSRRSRSNRWIRSVVLTSSPYVRSEEHTSELQSRFDLVC